MAELNGSRLEGQSQELKRCPECQEEKPEKAFAKNNKYKTGLFPLCKMCQWEKAEEKRRKNPKRIDPDRARLLWEDKLYSLQMIGNELGFSRVGIQKCLNRNGIDTSKQATWQTIKCRHCGKEIKRRRARVRNSEKQFCNEECYYNYLHNPGFYQWRHGTRIARKVLSNVFKVEQGNITHHIDGDQRNNDISNLMVFETAHDHHKWHRLDNPGVMPLFDGRTC